MKDKAAAADRRRRILDYAEEHSLVIHPARGYDYYVEAVGRHGHCPCDARRLDCPCPQAAGEANEQGHCLCRLFFRDNKTFKEMYCKE